MTEPDPAAEARLRMIDELLAQGSEEPFHYYARAMELRSLGRLEDALAAYGTVRERFPAYVPTYLMAAQVAQELDRLDDARAWVADGITRAAEAGDDQAARELAQLRDLLD
ncbi:MAG: tetratricopeptide repeat protein [Sandaracinaceae bacterium]